MKGRSRPRQRADRSKPRTAGCRSSSTIPRTSKFTAARRRRKSSRDFGDKPLDAIITGVGTGGHITACAEVLKPVWPNLKVFAVEPALSPILSGGAPGPHPIQGLGANFIPSILNTEILDGIIDVDADKAKEMARRAAREEGLLIGISSGAALAGVEQKLPELGDRPRILTFNYDTGERYLSVPDFLPERGLTRR